jgi:hypothetical protein
MTSLWSSVVVVSSYFRFLPACSQPTLAPVIEQSHMRTLLHSKDIQSLIVDEVLAVSTVDVAIS